MAAAPARITAGAATNRGFCAGLPRAESGVPDRAPRGESDVPGLRHGDEQQHLRVVGSVAVARVFAEPGQLPPELRQAVGISTVEGDALDTYGHWGHLPKVAPPAAALGQSAPGGAETSIDMGRGNRGDRCDSGHFR